eukprot:CAMPEP_0172540542 /NCGR_PEP_ID=MMETSP1067-20121228/11531_1 /TAXON_ID=265564 ORGANISM="Thalassiosira punctigera, Strain Tpunct2005C2" /NCGR_SAMPLE_ID=MMETSP1067 /ASSEMBLY_ACC=CAM_ASM_000444 /LENGTH=189 /DNA_ID=CAMNT_0013326421 /DNA_START=34 /DNA_END=603 /DNA_ORIENTATION=-
MTMKSSSVISLVLMLLAFTHCQSFSISKVGLSSKNLCLLQAHTTSEEETLHSHSGRAITVDRRVILHSFVTAGSSLCLFSLKPSSAVAANTGAQSFVGKYSDPINHPGGTRTIKLVDGAIVGDYQLAEVLGGGGRGEPKDYVLLAVVVGGRAIIIDFSPKGGPKDFSGVLDNDGSIKFIRDGNRWPRLE